MKKIILLSIISTISNFVFAQFPNLVASSNAPVCNGNTLILSATHDTPSGGTTVAYSWTGPNNFTSTAQKPQRPNAATVDGTYTVTLTLSGTQTGTFTATTAVFTVITPIVTMKSYLQGDNLNVSNNFCEGNNMTLEATTDYTSGVSYSWTGPNGFSSTLQAPTISNVTAANAGNYQATITFNNSSCVYVSKRNYEITIGSPRLSISQNQVCSGGNVTLTPVLSPASATVSSYLWEGNNGFTSNSSSLTINNLQERKTYKLTAVFGGGCSGTAIAYATPQPMVPTPSVITRVFNCNVNVAASMPSTFAPAELTNYSWTGPGGFTSNQLAPQVTQAGDYTFTGTISGAGCNDVFTRTVTVPRIPSTTNPIINVSIVSTSEFTGGTTPSAQSSFCDGIDMILIGNISGDSYNTISYNWTGPNGFSSTLATPKITNFSAAKAGIYNLTITGTGNACNPTATATVSNSLFVGHNTAPSISSISFTNLNSPGTVFCSGSTVSMTPNLNTANSNNSLGTYSWTGPNGFTSTQRVPRISNVSAANEGVYSVTATFSTGCIGTATATATLNLSTQSSFSVTSRRIKFNNATGTTNCLGSTVELIAQTGGSIINNISWTGPNGFSSTALSPQIVNATAANSGYYYATIDMGGECPATITRAANLTFSNTGVLPFGLNRVNTDPTSDNRSVCLGNNIKLFASPLTSSYYQATYSWSGPNGFTSNDIAPTISNIDASKLGTYTLNVNYTDGCTGSVAVTTTINTNPPTFSIGTVGGSAFCNGSPVSFAPTLALTNIDTYSWTGPNGFTSNQSRAIIPSVSASNIGVYTLTVNIGGSCPATVTATTNLAYETAPATTTIRFTEQITNAIGNNQCAGSNIILSLPNLVTSQITSYSWSGPGGFSSNLASPVVTNSQAGTYSATVTYLACGVVSTVTATASLTNTKTVTLAARNQGGASASSFCSGSNIELFIASTNPVYALPNSYSWAGPNGFSSTAATPLISSATSANGGVYTLTVNFGNPCAGTVTATVSITIANYQFNLFARRAGQINSFTFCSGTNVELYPSTMPSSGTISAYSWTGPNGFSSTAALPQIANIQSVNAGTYSLMLTVSGGSCAGTYTATTNLTVGNTTQNITSSTASTQCAGGSITLFTNLSNQSYGTGTTYSWSGPNGFSSTLQNNALLNLQAVNSGTYTVTTNFPFSSGCATAGTLTNTYRLSIGNTSANILSGQEQSLSANTNFPLNIEVLGGTLPISITLSNGASFTINNTNGSNGNIITVNTSVATSQTISISSITSSCGAGTGTGSAVITVPETCPTTATALSRIQGSGTPSTSFCLGTNVELYATFNTTHSGATYTYNWTGPNGYNSTSATPLLSNAQASNAGTYSVTVTFGGSCTGTASATRAITVANPTLIALARRNGQSNAYNFCAGTAVELYTSFSPTSPTVSSYSWSGPNGFSSTAASPQIANFQATNAGTYVLSAVVSGTCAGTYTASLILGISNTVSPSIAFNGNSVQCPGGSLTLFPLPSTGNFSSGSTFSWSGPNNFSSTQQFPILNNLQAVNSGTYTVTVVYPATTGCASFSGTSTMTTKLSVGNTAANILPNQNQTVASGVSFPLNIEVLGGTLPISMTLSNGSSFTISFVNGSTGNIYTANTSVTTAQTISISSISSSCSVGTGTGSAVISIGIPCPPSLLNYSNTINNTVVQYREASGAITTQAVTVNSGGKLTLDSGKSILLQPGFEAKTGSVFRAFIDGCGGTTN
ncbi:MAG: beta strand repeat-containing protein [Emticicia sp.]|uniref:beta strand repeat-containing protein n=1 Tax=Emticicia sp. TaxID=1930953 RepID=UPI003BA71286